MVSQLWFDVGIKRYTTHIVPLDRDAVLWFDVGIKRYTTIKGIQPETFSCGLM